MESTFVNWKIAYRIRNSKEQFYIIKNPFWCWAADPFLFMKDGVIYIFAELWLYHLNRGCIGFCTIENGNYSKWKLVIKERYHISYPFIWEDESGIHIMAETCGNKTIHRYTANRFPYEWTKDQVFLSGDKYADSTILFDRNGVSKYLFTYIVKGINKGNLERYDISDGIVEAKSKYFVSENSEIARPGGSFIYEGEMLYRVAQNCSESYGKSLNFMKVICCDAEKYEEIKEYELDLSQFNRVTQGLKVIGIHTYNRLDSYEVVDIRCYKTNYYSWLCKLIRLLGGKILRTLISG